MECMQWEKVERLAELKGIRKGQIADAMSTSGSRVSEWIKGKWRPDINQSLRIARLLGVPLDYLADDEMDELPAPQITPEEMKVLEMVRDLGVDVARKRLLQAPTIEFLGQGVVSRDKPRSMPVRKSGG